MANPKDVSKNCDVVVSVADAQTAEVVYSQVVSCPDLLERYKKILLVQEVLNRKSRSKAQGKLEV